MKAFRKFFLYILFFSGGVLVPSVWALDKPQPLPSFATEEEMKKATTDFNDLYRGIGFLYLMGAKDALKNAENRDKERNLASLHRVCETLVYRLGSKLPMSLVGPKESNLHIAVSLKDEQEAYRYILVRKSPFLWLSRYNEGGKYRRFLQNPKDALAKSQNFVEWNKDYLTFAETITYFVHSPHPPKGSHFDEQDRKNPVFQKYQKILCSSEDPENDMYDLATKAMEAFKLLGPSVTNW